MEDLCLELLKYDKLPKFVHVKTPLLGESGVFSAFSGYGLGGLLFINTLITARFFCFVKGMISSRNQ
jgi:hypothetical protein